MGKIERLTGIKEADKLIDLERQIDRQTEIDMETGR